MPLPEFITPKKFIKSQWDNVLQLDGLYYHGTKELENTLRNLWDATVNEHTYQSLLQIVIELKEQIDRERKERGDG